MQKSTSFEKDIAPFLRARLEDEIRLYDKRPSALKRADALVERWGREDHNTEAHRFQLLNELTSNKLADYKILDMAAGCGNFVFQGLKQGLHVEGIEPEEWKNELWRKKIEVFKLNPEWLKQFHNGIGEQLPFEKSSFQIVDSWQTFEHVQSVSSCMKELFRVLSDDGFAVIRMPGYASFYEGHYMLAWLPYMQGGIAKLWLKIFNRPSDGLGTFYIRTQCSIKREARQAGFSVYDVKKLQYKKHLATTRGIKSNTISSALYHIRMMISNVFKIFREERTVHLLLVKSKSNIAKDSVLLNYVR